MGFSQLSKATLLALVLFICSSVNPSMAQQKSNAKSKINQSQAIAMAQKKVGGRVLRVKETSNMYRVKMLQASGRVISVDVNRSTGKIEQSLSSKGKGK